MSTDADGIILVHEDEGLATITINRPEHGNRFTGAMWDFLARTLDRLAAEGRSRVLLLRSVGPDFSLGREYPNNDKKPTPLEVRTELARVTRANASLEHFPGVSIAVVQGRAAGAGCSLAGRCDLVLAAESARFSFPEITYAVAPTIVMSYFCKRLLRRHAFELVVTGREISAAEAQRIGLVNRVVPSDSLEAEASALVEQLLSYAPEVLGTCKQFVQRLDEMSIDSAAEYGISLLANIQGNR